MPLANLPRIIRFEGCYDSGEYGATTCPHCGADGRYVYSFICEDGQRHGAMAGCIQLFPVSELAKAHRTVIDKERTGKRLNNWDKRIVEAVNDAAEGRCTTDEALIRVRAEKASRQEWMRRKGFIR